MPTFTIDSDNNITAHGSPEEAAAANTTPFDSFSNQQELTELVAGWPAERVVAVWNSLPGVEPVKRFKSSNAAAGRMWERIQGLGESAKPREERKAKGTAPAAKGAPAKAKASKKAAAAKKEPKGKKAPRRRKPPGRGRAAKRRK